MKKSKLWKLALAVVFILALITFILLLSSGCAMDSLGAEPGSKRIEASWGGYAVPENNYDQVFFQCNNTPYNPDFIAIHAQLMNNQDLPEVLCGESFILLKQVRKGWAIVPFADDVSFSSLTSYVDSGMSFTYELTPEMLAYPLTEGNYRIFTEIHTLKQGDVDYIPYKLWADFTVDKNAPKQEEVQLNLPYMWAGNPHGQQMTLDDVRKLASYGNRLELDNLLYYQGSSVSSDTNYYIIIFGIEDGYRLVMHSAPDATPDSVTLQSVWEDGASGIDIRYEDIDEFLAAHPSQPVIPEDDALVLAQEWTDSPLVAVNWQELGQARYMVDLLDSLDELAALINEPCWLFADNETQPTYYAVGKKNGAVYTGIADAYGTVDNWQQL